MPGYFILQPSIRWDTVCYSQPVSLRDTHHECAVRYVVGLQPRSPLFVSGSWFRHDYLQMESQALSGIEGDKESFQCLLVVFVIKVFHNSGIVDRNGGKPPHVAFARTGNLRGLDR